jgi:nicotinamidase-related amidase
MVGMNRALLVVDVQHALTEALDPPRRASFLATLTGLLSEARAAGVPVVYVRHQDEELAPGSRGWAITADIAPAAGDDIVEKRFRDAFRETNLDAVLRRLGAERVVVCGMQSEFCVDATVREAERRGYAVTLVADGHATYPAGGLSEEQIRDHIHRVAWGEVADIAPASSVFRVAPSLGTD